MVPKRNFTNHNNLRSRWLCKLLRLIHNFASNFEMLLTRAKIPEQLCSCCCCCCCCCCCSVELTLDEWKWLRRATTASRLLWSKVFVVIEKQKSIIKRTLKIFSSQTIQRVTGQQTDKFLKSVFLARDKKTFSWSYITSTQQTRLGKHRKSWRRSVPFDPKFTSVTCWEHELVQKLAFHFSWRTSRTYNRGTVWKIKWVE